MNNIQHKTKPNTQEMIAAFRLLTHVLHELQAQNLREPAWFVSMSIESLLEVMLKLGSPPNIKLLRDIGSLTHPETNLSPHGNA